MVDDNPARPRTDLTTRVTLAGMKPLRIAASLKIDERLVKQSASA